MEDLIALYRQKLHLPQGIFLHIDHEDAIFATVFKITHPGTILLFF